MNFEFQKNCDIAVAGAGIAGVAAALAAARRGHKVILIEKQSLIGGLATSGLIYIYLPLCDGNGTQVTFGIAEELLKRSLDYSPYDLNERWGGPSGGRSYRNIRYECDFSPAGFTLSLDKMLLEAGVELWLDTRVCAVELAQDKKITAVEVENDSGRGKISARQFIDATGSATLIQRAGGKTLPPGSNFQAMWMIQRAPGENLPYHMTDQIQVKALGNAGNGTLVTADPRRGRSVTEFIRASWQTARNYYDESYRQGNSRYDHYPLHLPAMAQLRKIARIDGLETLDDNSQWQVSENSIGLYADWRRPGKVYETPYGTLLPADIRGVFACGRCMSAANDAWESFRVIPAAAMTGEAAGTAAALAVEKNCDGCELTAEQVRTELRKNNFKVHFQEVGLDPAETLNF